MLIPVRCVTCGSLISDKWLKYLELVSKHRPSQIEDIELLDADVLNSDENKDYKTAEYKALEELKITRMCCRRHYLCNVDLIDTI